MERSAICALGLLLSACATVVDSTVLRPHSLLPTASGPGARRPVVHSSEDLRRALLSVSAIGYEACAVRLDGDLLGHSPLVDLPITLGGHTLVLTCDRALLVTRSFELFAEWRLEVSVRRARPLPGQIAQAIVTERRLGPDPEARRRRHGPTPDPRALVVLAALQADFSGADLDADSIGRRSPTATAGLQQ
ncbi:MAG: hypothetical protein HY903_09945 [Deltaproteobacteria bacterium]|nr:hypothetical protein [Deltaproteobacteria bacterium]